MTVPVGSPYYVGVNGVWVGINTGNLQPPGVGSLIVVNLGNNQSVVAGTDVPIPPSVRVTDASGVVVENVPVTFAIGLGGGDLTGASQTTDASGIATVGSWTTGSTPGVNTLTATSDGLSGSPVTFTATGTGSAPPTFVGAGPLAFSAGTISPAWPTGHAFGDIGLMWIETANQAIATTPTGWTLVSAPGVGTAGNSVATKLTVLWRRASGPAMAAQSIGDSGDHQIAQILVFRGCFETGNPYDPVGTGSQTSAITGISIPGVATPAINRYVVVAVTNVIDTSVAQANDDFVNATLGSFSKLSNINSNAGNGGGFSIWGGTKASLGTIDATTGTLKAASAQAMVCIPLKPAAGITGGGGSSPSRTRIGLFGLGGLSPNSKWGLQPYPDTVFADENGASYRGSGGYIQAARDASGGLTPPCSFIFKGVNKAAWSTKSDPLVTTGANAYDPSSRYFDARGNEYFNLLRWKDGFDSFYTGLNVAGGVLEMEHAVRDGIVPAMLLIDDYITDKSTAGLPGYFKAVTYEELEAISQYVKSFMPWMPCVGRGRNSYHLKACKSPVNGAIRQYKWFDAGWAQARASDAPDPTKVLAYFQGYFSTEVQAGKDCGLGTISGGNISATGTGVDPAYSPAGAVAGKPHCLVAGAGCINGRCAFSPAETVAVMLAAMANTDIAGFYGWAWSGKAGCGSTYILSAEILAAWQTGYNQSVVRGNDAKVHIRGTIVDAT